MANKPVKIAIIVNGGINSGYQSQGVPTLMRLVNMLNVYYQITVYTLVPANHFKGNFTLRDLTGRSPFKWIKFLFYFLTDHFNGKFQIIHGFWGFPAGWLAVLLGKRLGIPSVVTLMGGESASLTGSVIYGGMTSKRLKRKTFWMLHSATRVIVLSEFQKIQLSQNGFTGFDHFSLIPFGVSETSDKPRPLSTNTPFKLIHVGNINLVKDHKTLLEAFCLIKEKLPVTLQIVGGDFLDRAIQKVVKDKGLESEITFSFQVSNKEVHQLINKADLMIISSLSEGQSVVFVEALAHGVPVCSTKVGLMYELSGTCCLTSPIERPDLLAENVLKVFEDPQLYMKLSDAGLEWTKENNEIAIFERYRNIYESVL